MGAVSGLPVSDRISPVETVGGIFGTAVIAVVRIGSHAKG
jgi:hypothetical protein